jgi:hypothetical protein
MDCMYVASKVGSGAEGNTAPWSKRAGLVESNQAGSCKMFNLSLITFIFVVIRSMCFCLVSSFNPALDLKAL